MRRALAVVIAAVTPALAACAADEPEVRRAHDQAAALGHVHGLGTDPADGTLYVATHFGVFRVAEGELPVRVADRWQDTMAFTVVGPRHFLASGHPDLREDLPPHLGLVESRDAARTWRPLSLHGEADFHLLEAAGDLLYGYDAVTGRLLVTDDRRTWRLLDRRPVVDAAADPAGGGVLASTPAGDLLRYPPPGTGSSDGPAVLAGAPALTLLDWPTPNMLVGATARGVLHRSGNGGRTWQEVGALPGPLVALDVTDGPWFAATADAVLRSDDAGRSWRRLVTAHG